MKRQKRGQKSKKKITKSIGKAAVLPGHLWRHWLEHVLQNGRCWLYAGLLISHLLRLRITECMRLTCEDFSFKTSTVYIAPLKRQNGMRKPMLPSVKRILLELKKKGVSRRRSENKGSRGKVTWWDKWKWPAKGKLFPAQRDDCHTSTRNKDTVAKAISRLRKTFEQPVDRTIRSHSGRHTMINTLKATGIPDEVGMFYARISDKQTYAGYGSFTSTQATEFIKKSKTLRKSLVTVYSKTKKMNGGDCESAGILPNLCFTSRRRSMKTYILNGLSTAMLVQLKPNHVVQILSHCSNILAITAITLFKYSAMLWTGS